MGILGKEVDFIKLYNFLDKIEAKNIYSALHTSYTILMDNKDEQGNVYYKDKKFPEETFLRILRMDKDTLHKITFGEHSVYGRYEVTLSFRSGNEYIAFFDKDNQYIQLLEFLDNNI